MEKHTLYTCKNTVRHYSNTYLRTQGVSETRGETNKKMKIFGNSSKNKNKTLKISFD